jgi:cytochrome c oxidase assembly factor 4
MDEKGNFDLKKIIANRPEGLHKGVTQGQRKTDEVDIEGMIDRSGCGPAYYELEECLGEHDRNWKMCQKEVHALRECSKVSKK